MEKDKKKSDIFVLSSNVDSLQNKFFEFKLFKSLHKLPDIISLFEVNPKMTRYQHQISEFQIQGFQLLHAGFDIKGHRGIFIYCSEKLHITEQ